MATTNFVDGVTLTDDEWFNDVDALTYQVFGTATTSSQIRANILVSTSVTTFTTVSAHIYVSSVAMRYALVMVKGGGGAGGGTNNNNAGGCGGSEGETAWKYIAAADMGASQTVTVGGAASSIAANTNANGTTGSTCSFGALVTAVGGTGGTSGPNGSAPQPGGTGGSGADWAMPGATGLSGATATASHRIYSAGGGNGGGVNVAPDAVANSGGGGAGSSTATGVSGAGGTGICVVQEYY